MSRVATSIVTAWFTGSHTGPDDITQDPQKLIAKLGYSNGNMNEHGWSKCGIATITVEFIDPEELVKEKVRSLDDEIQMTYAQAEAKVRHLKGLRDKLLAISCDVVEAV